MTKREYCNRPTIGYYSGFCGLEIKDIENTADGDYMYCVSGAWTGLPEYHRLKIRRDRKYPYVKLHGYTVRLDECIRNLH